MTMLVNNNILSKREIELISIAASVAGGYTPCLKYHLKVSKKINILE